MAAKKKAKKTKKVAKKEASVVLPFLLRKNFRRKSEVFSFCANIYL